MVPLNLLPPAALSLAGEQMCMFNGDIWAQHASSVVVQQQQHVAREHQMVPLICCHVLCCLLVETVHVEWQHCRACFICGGAAAAAACGQGAPNGALEICCHLLC